MSEHDEARPADKPQFGNIRDASEAFQRLAVKAMSTLGQIDAAIAAARQQGVDFSLISFLPHPTVRAKIAEDLPTAAPFECEDLVEGVSLTAAGLFGFREPTIDRLTRKQRKELGLTFKAVRLVARAMRKDGTWDALDEDGRAEAVKQRLQAERAAAYGEYAADIDWAEVMVWIQFVVQIISMFLAVFMFI